MRRLRSGRFPRESRSPRAPPPPGGAVGGEAASCLVPVYGTLLGDFGPARMLLPGLLGGQPGLRPAQGLSVLRGRDPGFALSQLQVLLVPALLLLAAVMLAACLSGCGTEVKAKGQMIGGVSMGRGL